MKVRVDFDLCDANALCEAIAPATFQLDDDEELQILDDSVTTENEADVRRAVRACPVQAIALVET